MLRECNRPAQRHLFPCLFLTFSFLLHDPPSYLTPPNQNITLIPIPVVSAAVTRSPPLPSLAPLLHPCTLSCSRRRPFTPREVASHQMQVAMGQAMEGLQRVARPAMLIMGDRNA